MITVMTGQVVDFFDRDFRELYAISEKLNLYKEFHVSPPTTNMTATVCTKAARKRPLLPATTSRFQVSLGDSRNAEIQVPAHKFYNPKYSLVFPRCSGSLQDFEANRGAILAEVSEEETQGRPRLATLEKMDRVSPLPSEAPSETFKKPNRVSPKKRGLFTWRKKMSKGKSSSTLSVKNKACSSPFETPHTDESIEDFVLVSPSKGRKRLSKLDQRTGSQQTVNSAHDGESKSSTF